MKKKAQITMESLLLYGAAILVVLLAIAALTYFGVLDLGRLLPDKCNFEGTGGLRCDDYKADATSASEIQIEVTNKGTKGYAIASSSRFVAEDSTMTGDCPIVGSPTIAPGNPGTLLFNCDGWVDQPGSRISGKVELDYTFGGALNHKGFGQLTVTTTGGTSYVCTVATQAADCTSAPDNYCFNNACVECTAPAHCTVAGETCLVDHTCGN
jgi:hypothetical protein